MSTIKQEDAHEPGGNVDVDKDGYNTMKCGFEMVLGMYMGNSSRSGSELLNFFTVSIVVFL